MDMNCSDFDNQAQAQNYFENNGGSPSNNVDGLDADGDGTVCESNPCPCSDYDGGSGGGGGGTQPKPFHKLSGQKGKVDGKTVAFGKVTTYKGERIRIMRRVEGAKFMLFKTVVTKAATGKYNVAISSPQGKTSCFRVAVPATNKYKLTTKAVGCVG
jgi:hypothetical protein